MSTNSNFCEYQGRDDKGDFIVRLGHTTYKYSLGTIYKKGRDEQFVKLSLEDDVAKPWIRQNLDREIKFQLRKKVAETFQNFGYSAEEKRAYKRRMNWAG